MKHIWICDNCGKTILFKQPEREQDDPRSEQNDDKTCPDCGEEMYFDETD